MIIESYKPIGPTTVEHINEFKKTNNVKKLCFAGRLDPLAYGKIIILTDEDIYKKVEYCNKDKVYETWIIKGFKTDSYDIMGLPMISYQKEEMIPKKLKQKYPPYSSVIVPKYHKPFWLVTKEGLKMEEEDIPTKDIEIYKIETLENQIMSANQILEIIKNRIKKVNQRQQFRQEKIIMEWEDLLEKYTDNINVVKIRVHCSSGTYIRNIGNMLNGCCYDIHRVSYLN